MNIAGKDCSPGDFIQYNTSSTKGTYVFQVLDVQGRTKTHWMMSNC